MSTPRTSASEPGPSVAHPRFRATANARGAQRKSVLTVFPSVSLRPARSGAGGAGLPHSRANGVFAATPHATTGARESTATRGGPAARQGAAGRGAPPPPGRTRGCGARGADPGGGALRFLACSSSSGQLGRVPSSCHADVDSARPRRERVGSSHRGSCAELAGDRGARKTGVARSHAAPAARRDPCGGRSARWQTWKDTDRAVRPSKVPASRKVFGEVGRPWRGSDVAPKIVGKVTSQSVYFATVF